MTGLPPTAPPDVLSARRERLLQTAARAGIEAIVATRPEHVCYLTGCDGPGPRALLMGENRATLIAPADPKDANFLAGQGLEVMTFIGYSPDRMVEPSMGFARALGSVISSARPKRLGYDSPFGLGQLVGAGAVDVVDATDVFAVARRPRDHWEIAQIRGRVAIVEAGLRAARSSAAAGMSELEIAIAALQAITLELGEMVSFDHNIGSGPRSALADPHASERVIADGELLLVDLYPPLRGYFADLTRTWVVGRVAPRAARMHQAVVAALRSGERLLGPGASVSAIDREVRESLRAAGGLDASMGHHTGHGLGIFAWEHPWIGSASDETLIPGDVIALEPGTYLAGSGGIRLEGNYLITEDGYERIDTLDEELAA